MYVHMCILSSKKRGLPALRGCPSSQFYLIFQPWRPTDQSFCSSISSRKAVVLTGANRTVFQASLAVPYVPAAVTGSHLSPAL